MPELSFCFISDEKIEDSLILAGEKDFERLRIELDYQRAYIVRRIFAALSGKPAPSEHAIPTDEATAQQEEPEDEAQGIT